MCGVDGIHHKVRLEQDKVCLLVMIGVPADGTKELVALSDGFRESSESWADLLRDCKRRGMSAPVLAVGDGALGFWKAIRDVFPDSKEQRCWWHKIGNMLAALPKSAHPAAKKALAEIYNADNKAAAVKAAHAFATEYGAKWPKVGAKIVDDLDVLTAFYDYPAEHWIHLRTTDERFKARVALSVGWDGVSLLGGRGRPRSQEQGRGAGSPAAQLAP
jgi:transposase-like protein